MNALRGAPRVNAEAARLRRSKALEPLGEKAEPPARAPAPNSMGPTAGAGEAAANLAGKPPAPRDERRPASARVLRRQDSSAQHVFVQTNTKFHLECDDDFVICGCDVEACAALKCSEAQLIGLPVTSLMSPLVAKLHEGYFKRLRACSPAELASMRARLERSMSRANMFAIYDFEKNPLMCALQVLVFRSRFSIVTLTVKLGPNSPLVESVPREFMGFINQEPGLHVKDYKNVTCIMLDIAGSQELCLEQGPLATAGMFFDVHKIAKEVVLQMYPFVYIHELVGDSVFLVVNASFMVNHLDKPTLLAMHVAATVSRKIDAMLSNKYKSKAQSPGEIASPSQTCGADAEQSVGEEASELYTRAGITCGAVCAGVIDSRSFRIFGSTVHLAQRLEAKCPAGQLAMCGTVRSMLAEQAPSKAFQRQLEEAVTERRELVKGFGLTDYHIVGVDSGVDWLAAHVSE